MFSRPSTSVCDHNSHYVHRSPSEHIVQTITQELGRQSKSCIPAGHTTLLQRCIKDNDVESASQQRRVPSGLPSIDNSDHNSGSIFLCHGLPIRKATVQQISARTLRQVTIYFRLRIGQDGHLDQSEAYDIS